MQVRNMIIIVIWYFEIIRKPRTSSFYSCSTTPSTPLSNSAGTAAAVRKGSAVKCRRQSNLADIKSDQECLTSSSETLLMANTNTDNGYTSVRRATIGPRVSNSVKETGRKIEKRGNVKTERALSTIGRPDVGEVEDKKVGVFRLVNEYNR
jgi:hypothetical protein